MVNHVPAEISSVEIPPSVSVIIPAYKTASYIREAVDSVFKQSFSSLEVIVINDGSPDTEDLERELQGFPLNLVYIKQENKGAAAARNAGLHMARGEFVAFLDADDRWLPDFLSEQMDFLKRHDADLVYSDAFLFGDSPLAGRSFMDVQPSRGPVTPENLLTVNVTILTSAVLARKAPIINVGLFDETLRRGHDFELWLRLARCGARIAYHHKILAHHRIVESGLSGDTISQLERTLNVLDAIKRRTELTPSENAALRRNRDRTLRELALEHGKEKLIDRDFSGALHSFKEAQKFQNSWKLRAVCLGLRIAPEIFWRAYHRRVETPHDEQ